MKLVSKFAFAFVLGSVAFAPSAYAQKAKKDKKSAEAAAPAEKKPVLSKAFQAAYAPAVNPFLKNDFVGAKAAWPAAKAAAQTDDEKYQAGIFAVQLAGKTNDNVLRDEGYALLLASNFTPPSVRQDLLFNSAAISYDAKDFATAGPKLIAAYDAGYRKADIESLIASSYSQQKNYAQALAWAERGIEAKKAAGQAAPVSYLRQAAGYSVNLNDPARTNQWMKILVQAENNQSNWRDMLNLYMRKANLSADETLDIMRLMRRNKAMKYPTEYAIYVESLGARRYPVEAMAVIEEGIAAGHVEASDRDIKEEYDTAKQLAAEDVRSLGGAEASARSSASGNVITLTADAFMSQRKFDIAESLYQLALTKSKIVDNEGLDRTDRTIMRLAMAKAAQQNWAGAKAELAKITSGKRKEIAEYWTMYIDQQMAKPAA